MQRSNATDRSDDGQSAPLLLAVVAIAGLLMVATARAGVMLIDHQRARAAADAAALAAADAIATGGSPTDIAARVATANGATVVDLTVDGEEVVVRVEVAGTIAVARASTAGP